MYQSVIFLVCLVSIVCGSFLDVSTKNGVVHGQVSSIDKNIRTFLGIPYAQPPVGDLRWAPPKPALNWNGTLQANQFGYACMQPTLMDGEMSEDCLTLNVFAPIDATNMAVMIWIYGGSFVFGGSALPIYEGSRLAATQPYTIVVTVNYRLGAFGWLASDKLRNSSGPEYVNFGLQDQQLAIKWVRENIINFGGNPDTITLFGESAGSMSISTHLFMKGNENLFRRVAMESGTTLQGAGGPLVHTSYNFKAQEAVSENLLENYLHCDSIQCARNVSALEILSAQTLMPNSTNKWQPVIDGYWVPQDPLKMAQNGKYYRPVDVMIGDVTNEGTMFVDLTMDDAKLRATLIQDYGADTAAKIASEYPSQEYLSPGYCAAKIFNDYFFTCPARRLLNLLQSHGTRVLYQWQFAHLPSWISCPGVFCPELALGIAHASELYYVFGNELDPFNPFTPEEDNMSFHMRTDWSNFAVGNALSYPQWRNDTMHYVIYNTTDTMKVSQYYDKHHCDFWDSLTKSG